MTTLSELQSLLPWYVNGTLNVGARRALERELAQSPHLRGEVAWLQLTRSQIRENTQAESRQRADDTGLNTLMALVHGEQSGKVFSLPSRLDRLVAATRRLPLSVGIAAVIVLAQAVVIGTLLDQPAQETLRVLSGGTVVSGQLLQVTFKPLATESQIRKLLASVQGDIVAGPGALGVYVVRVPESQAMAALERLRGDSNTIESVVLLSSR